MNKRKYTKTMFLTALILISGIIFLALMSSLTLLFGNRKADITDTHRYGLKAESIEISKQIDNPITITVYVSDDLDSNYPELDLHRQNIIRLLEQYQNLSDGKITLDIKNPEPYSPAEYEAQSLNIRAFPDTENTKNLYFGATFSNSEGERYIIPYFSIQRQNYAEYDISRIIGKLNGFNKKNIGVVSFGGNIENLQIIKKIKEDYPVKYLNNKTSVIPPSIQTLLIFNPQQVDVGFIYALDQYIMRGGNLILFVDPYAEAVGEKYPYTKKNTNKLLPLLKSWGVELNEKTVVADTKLSRDEYQTALSQTSNPTHINLSAEQMNIPNIMGGNQIKLTMYSAGELSINPLENIEYQALFSTTENGKTVPAEVVKFSDVETINNHLPAETKKYPLAYLIQGNFKSFFEKSIISENNFSEKFPPYIPISLKPSKIVVIADSDFLTDETWNLTGYQKDSSLYDQIPSSNNADFILSMIDYMNNNESLSKLHVSYLINDDKNIVEQIYSRVFNTHLKEYEEKEKQVAQLQSDLYKFQQKLSKREIGMTLMKIQELDEYNRRQQQIKEDIKVLNYQIQQESGQIVNQIIFANMLFIPMIILILSYAGVKICIYYRKKKNQRIINE